MKRTYFVGLMALLVVPQMAGAIGFDVRRVTPANRPYIVEIGEPESLSPQQLAQERDLNEDLKLYLGLYGWPDVAERQEIEPFYPWYAYEVRLYYLDRNAELAFGRAYVSVAIGDLGSVKYRGNMDSGTHDRIAALVGTPQIEAEPQPVAFQQPVQSQPVVVATADNRVPNDAIESMVQRIESAAERASQAADRAAEASERANVAADRTVNVLEKIAP